jgi:hypothetical protein
MSSRRSEQAFDLAPGSADHKQQAEEPAHQQLKKKASRAWINVG